MGRQEAAAEIRRKKLVSATGVSGDTQRGSERLALCSQDTFHISKTSELLGEGKRVWEASALQSCFVCCICLFSGLCPACMEVRKAKIFFWRLSFHYLIHHESIYSHCSFGTDVADRKCCFGQLLINMFKTRHCYSRFSIRVKVSLKYRTSTETFPKIKTKLGNHSLCTNLISSVVSQTRLSCNPFTGA